jgi:gluconate 5-dehydrogenase
MSLERFDLAGRTALVTGSSRGIGLALARGLGQAHARVVLNGRRPEAVAAAVDALRAEGIDAQAAAFDVTDGAAVEAGVARVEAEVAPLDVLVNNAGVQHREPLHEIPEAAFRGVIETNLMAVFLVGQAVGRRMVGRGRGKIINIASEMSELARPTVGAYAAAKGGVKMLTQAMCADWAPHGVQANGIAPGFFSTELNRALAENPEFDAWLRGRTPAGRWGEVDELVGAAVFLASDASSFVNGQLLFVDGGMRAVM